MKSSSETRASMPNQEPMLKEELSMEIDFRAQLNYREYYHPRFIPEQILSWLIKHGYKVDPKQNCCMISW